MLLRTWYFPTNDSCEPVQVLQPYLWCFCCGWQWWIINLYSEIHSYILQYIQWVSRHCKCTRLLSHNYAVLAYSNGYLIASSVQLLLVITTNSTVELSIVQFTPLRQSKPFQLCGSAHWSCKILFWKMAATAVKNKSEMPQYLDLF